MNTAIVLVTPYLHNHHYKFGIKYDYCVLISNHVRPHTPTQPQTDSEMMISRQQAEVHGYTGWFYMVWLLEWECDHWLLLDARNNPLPNSIRQQLMLCTIYIRMFDCPFRLSTLTLYLQKPKILISYFWAVSNFYPKSPTAMESTSFSFIVDMELNEFDPKNSCLHAMNIIGTTTATTS